MLSYLCDLALPIELDPICEFYSWSDLGDDRKGFSCLHHPHVCPILCLIACDLAISVVRKWVAHRRDVNLKHSARTLLTAGITRIGRRAVDITYSSNHAVIYFLIRLASSTL